LTHKEASSTISETEERKSPEISESDGVAETGDEEVQGVFPVASAVDV